MTHPVSAARLHSVLEEMVASRTRVFFYLLSIVIRKDVGLRDVCAREQYRHIV